MFWFKNIMIYRLTSALNLNHSELEAQLAPQKFSPCLQHDLQKFGWFAPLVGSEMLHFSQGNQFLLISHKEEKILPANVIKKPVKSALPC